jgi:hypothetical protein
VEKRKSHLHSLREKAPFAWYLLYLELDVPLSMSDCLQRLHSNFHMGKDRFYYRASKDTEVIFTISRDYGRTELKCFGALQQISEHQTRLYAQLGNNEPRNNVYVALVFTLFGIVLQSPMMIFAGWGLAFLVAWRTYRTQHELAHDLERVVLRR